MAWYSLHLLLLDDKVHNMAAKTRKRMELKITNSQNMFIWEN